MPWLMEEVDLVDPRLILLAGRCALSAFRPDDRVSQVHGRPVEHAGRTLLPLFHPAAAIRTPSLRPVLLADVAAVQKLLSA